MQSTGLWLWSKTHKASFPGVAAADRSAQIWRRMPFLPSWHNLPRVFHLLPVLNCRFALGECVNLHCRAKNYVQYKFVQSPLQGHLHLTVLLFLHLSLAPSLEVKLTSLSRRGIRTGSLALKSTVSKPKGNAWGQEHKQKKASGLFFDIHGLSSEFVPHGRVVSIKFRCNILRCWREDLWPRVLPHSALKAYLFWPLLNNQPNLPDFCFLQLHPLPIKWI